MINYCIIGRVSMNYKIIADSSADVLSMEGVSYASVPLTILAAGKQYVDDETLDVDGLVADLRACKEKTSTACPGTAQWLQAFGDAEGVFCVTITSSLSGTYNAARLAAREYEEKHPGRRAYVLDSLSTGPEMQLIVEKLAELVQQQLSFDEIVKMIEAYRKHTYLLFSLKNLHNLVVNGRVSPALGALVGLLGIRVIGRASEGGELQTLTKSRGDKKALQALMSHLRELGFQGGRVRIHHCGNESFATAIKEAILAFHPAADIRLAMTRGLCSFYAEEGGVLVGFEGE